MSLIYLTVHLKKNVGLTVLCIVDEKIMKTYSTVEKSWATLHFFILC